MSQDNETTCNNYISLVYLFYFPFYPNVPVVLQDFHLLHLTYQQWDTKYDDALSCTASM